MDGIDIALLRSDGECFVERGQFAFCPYEPLFRRDIAKGLALAAHLASRGERPEELAALEREITLRHADVANRFIADSKLDHESVDLIGFHGQTVLHRPERSLTVQLGDGALLANELQIPVVFDLRAADMAKGGQGAPLVPAYHRALAANLPEELQGQWPVAFVNIGGIGNISWIDENGSMLAFDTGPGNALIDQWVADNAGIPYDQGGAIASEGNVIQSVADRYLAAPYFAKPGPKSLDRADFKPPEPGAMSLADGARTLSHVTAASIIMACDQLPRRPALWIIAGGGSHNLTIMRDLSVLLEQRSPFRSSLPKLLTAREVGFDGDAMEAEAWAYLAVRSFRGLNITWPGTTGVKQASTGGKLAYPEKEKV